MSKWGLRLVALWPARTFFPAQVYLLRLNDRSSAITAATCWTGKVSLGRGHRVRNGDPCEPLLFVSAGAQKILTLLCLC